MGSPVHFDPHVAVEVKERFVGRWHSGFAVHSQDHSGIYVTRLSDGSIIPIAFPPEDVRPAKHPGAPLRRSI